MAREFFRSEDWAAHVKRPLAELIDKQARYILGHVYTDLAALARDQEAYRALRRLHDEPEEYLGLPPRGKDAPAE